MIASTMILAGCASSSFPMTACKSDAKTAITAFDSVWFDGDGKIQWRFPWGMVAYETKGNLLLFDEYLEFRRSDGTGFEMRNIQDVTMKNLRMTFADPNQWIAVRYGLPPNDREVYFLDGAGLGWRKNTSSWFETIRNQYKK